MWYLLFIIWNSMCVCVCMYYCVCVCVPLCICTIYVYISVCVCACMTKYRASLGVITKDNYPSYLQDSSLICLSVCGREGNLWDHQSQKSVNPCEARRKSCPTWLSSWCWFKPQESNTRQFMLGTLKYSTIWKSFLVIINSNLCAH